jgi:hypothetical protein
MIGSSTICVSAESYPATRAEAVAAMTNNRHKLPASVRPASNQPPNLVYLYFACETFGVDLTPILNLLG